MPLFHRAPTPVSNGSPDQPIRSPLQPTFRSLNKPTLAISPPIDLSVSSLPPILLEENHKKNISDFTIIEDCGQGAYGEVKLARHRKSGVMVVLKYVIKKKVLLETWIRDRQLGTVPLEIHVLNYLRKDGLKHERIVEMSDFFEDSMNYYIEMVPHGLPGMDLFDYIELRHDTIQEAECQKIFAQVVDAVHHLHKKALVVHRDIKDENVVLDSLGNIKLIDFGSSAYIKNGPFEVFVGTIGKSLPRSSFPRVCIQRANPAPRPQQTTQPPKCSTAPNTQVESRTSGPWASSCGRSSSARIPSIAWRKSLAASCGCRTACPRTAST